MFVHIIFGVLSVFLLLPLCLFIALCFEYTIGPVASYIAFGLTLLFSLFGVIAGINRCEEIQDKANRTTYMIEMPNGTACEGKYKTDFSPTVRVNCVDGTSHVINAITVKYELFDHVPVLEKN